VNVIKRIVVMIVVVSLWVPVVWADGDMTWGQLKCCYGQVPEDCCDPKFTEDEGGEEGGASLGEPLFGDPIKARYC
jgi:hypothetical protein